MRPIGDGVDLPEVAQVPAKRTDVSVGYYRSETDLALDARLTLYEASILGCSSIPCPTEDGARTVPVSRNVAALP